MHVVAHPSGFVPPAAGALVPQRPRFHLYLVAGGSLLAALAIVAILFMVFGRSKAPGTSSTAAALPSSEIATNKPSPRPLPPVPLGTAQIAELATPSVVVVENYNEDGQKAELGSGYVFSPDGIVMTNYHVVRGAASLAVKIPGREETRVDSLLGYDVAHDVAALKLDGTFPALATEDADEVKTGARVVAIGAPLGLENTVSEGIVSAVREINGVHVIQTTASISPGSSGGPLLNEFGKVIGLTTAQMVNGQNLNFVIAAKHLIDLRNDGHPMTLAEMLAQTRVSEDLPQSTITVPARQAGWLRFTVPGQQGAVLEGSYSITGGGNDVNVTLVTLPNNAVLVNSGRVSSSGQFKQRLTRGTYTIFFDNRFSVFTSKSVSPDLKLVYYR
jgi:hypothetical protein